jgi:hypothetical protein
MTAAIILSPELVEGSKDGRPSLHHSPLIERTSPMKDGISGLGLVASLVPAVVTATTKGSHADLQGFNSATLIINAGAIAGDGLYAITMQESDTTTDGDFTEVAAGDLLGILPAALEASTVYKQDYVGNKRYIRAVITKTSGTSIAAGAIFALGHPHDAPVT